MKRICYTQNMLIYSLVLLLSFCTLWLASELIVNSMKKFAHRLNISSFAASFFVLGMLTSLPELSIGISSIIEKKPEIFVGNLIGGSVVLFLLIIPLLAIIGNGITVSSQLTSKHLMLALFVIILPAFSTLNGKLLWQESIIMLVLYGLLFYFIRKHKGIVETIEDVVVPPQEGSWKDLLKVIIGILFILGASRALVHVLPIIAESIGVPSFLASLLILSVGTNLPELFIAIQAIRSNDKDVALGDYIGSAAANTLLFSILSIASILLTGLVKIKNGEFLLTFSFFALGLIAFYFMARSKEEISRKEGILLLIIYIGFIASEIFFRN